MTTGRKKSFQTWCSGQPQDGLNWQLLYRAYFAVDCQHHSLDSQRGEFQLTLKPVQNILVHLFYPQVNSFSDLLLVNFDWQKGFGSHWNLILERIEILSLWILQSLFRDQRLYVKRLIDPCACDRGFSGRFTTLRLFEGCHLKTWWREEHGKAAVIWTMHL